MRSTLIAKLTMSTCLSTGLLCGAMVTPSAAITPHIVNDPQGNPFITLRFLMLAMVFMVRCPSRPGI